MPLLLQLETASEVCSVSLSKDGALLGLKENFTDKSHAELLSVFVEEILHENGYTAHQLDAVVVSKGPGSYTGLRIGVSVAKGIAFAADKPLIGVSTLQALALSKLLPSDLSPSTWLCPMLDARRMEVYTAFFDTDNQEKRKISADIIDEKSYLDILNERKVLFFGNGAAKCQSTITHPNAVFVDGVYCSAESMIAIAEQKYAAADFEDLAYFEPFYLKDFVATIPKKNIFT